MPITDHDATQAALVKHALRSEAEARTCLTAADWIEALCDGERDARVGPVVEGLRELARRLSENAWKGEEVDRGH